jgi:translation initiation factor IF-3
MNKLNLTVNREIRYHNVRVVEDGESKILDIHTAIALAADRGLDLVLINTETDPPICNIVDIDKYKYALRQKEKSTAKAQRASRVAIKEVQFKPNISDHDFDTKCRQISKFTEQGNTVKVQIRFKGRERQHTDIGFALITRITETLTDAVVDGKIQLADNRITVIIKGT